jgi:CheY-like chemotaxis protein
MFGRTKKEIRIHRKYQEDIWAVEVDQSQIDQVLLNLFVNAWQAMPGGGQMFIETNNVVIDESDAEAFPLPPGKYVRVSIADTGIGMDVDTRQRVFDPFFTTKGLGRGTGLGLASAYGIIKNHGGEISVSSEIGVGTTFDIYLAATKGKPVEIRPERLAPLRGDETILLVDDEEMVIDAGREILERFGYSVRTARSGFQAMEVYRGYRETIDLVILDMIMPDMGGSDTFEELKAIDSEVVVLLSSGYSLDGQASEILEQGCLGFIQKPFTPEQLTQKIRDILDFGKGRS